MKKDFSKYLFRASQIGILMTGTIGLTNAEKTKLQNYLKREQEAESGLLDDKGKSVKPLTSIMQEDVKALIEKRDSNALPKTMQTELRKIHRAETYNRRFNFTNKFTQKGIKMEEDAISLYQTYRNLKGIKTFFLNNKVRLENDFFSGEPDLTDTNDVSNCKEGFDTKASWELETFPFKDDKLDQNYEYQNQVYMDLTDTPKWTTVYTLVNCTEHQLFNEKQKWFYALEMPSEPDDKYYDQYIDKMKDCEKRFLFDYDAYVKRYNALMEISRKEWFENGYDIPMEERIVEKVSFRSKETLDEMKERIVIARKYLNSLNK